MHLLRARVEGQPLWTGDVWKNGGEQLLLLLEHNVLS